jgi:hypothetical protein
MPDAKPARKIHPGSTLVGGWPTTAGPAAVAAVMNRARESGVSRYVAALAAPLLIAAMMQATWPLFSTNSVQPFLLAVIF